MHRSTLSISSLRAVSKYSNGVYRDNKKKGGVDSVLLDQMMHSKNGTQGDSFLLWRT